MRLRCKQALPDLDVLDSTTKDDRRNPGISGGAIAGIVFGVLTLILGIVAFFILRRRQKPGPHEDITTEPSKRIGMPELEGNHGVFFGGASYGKNKLDRTSKAVAVPSDQPQGIERYP
jgi:hypothetical protein